MGSRKSAGKRPPNKTNADDSKLDAFVQEYLKDFNGKRAAIAVGYSEKTAESQASRLLRNVKVLDRLKSASAARIEKLEITGERILQRLAKIGFSDRTKDSDAIRALELLGKWREMGLWKETVELSKPKGEKSEEFKNLMSEVRALFGAVRSERGK